MFGTDWDIEDEALDGLEQGARSPALRIGASEGRYPMAVAGVPVQQAPVLPIYPLPAGIGQAAPDVDGLLANSGCSVATTSPSEAQEMQPSMK